MRRLFILLLFGGLQATAQQPVTYPYPVQYLQLAIEQQPASMAFMDVRPARANGGTVLLLHGKNFNGYYWKDVIPFLTEAGFRVIVPDQVGWGRSAKPNIHYSFHLLAANTKKLLDTLGVPQVHVIGHSMGGMLAVRFALMYPQTVSRLVLKNPIGLEDYRTFVPYQPLEKAAEKERQATYASYKKYQQTYYPEWKPAYEQYVAAQAESLGDTAWPQIAWVNARTYQMIYEQPVYYEFALLKAPTLIVIGQEDRTVVGKDLLPKEVAARRGNYPQLGKSLQQKIRGSKLVPLKGVGHIPHIQELQQFRAAVLPFLRP